MDPPHLGLPLQFPSAFSAVHGPIPVDHRTHEGRYLWDPRLHPLSHTSPGLSSGGTTPNLPDLSLLAQRRAAMINGHVENSMHPPYRISPYMEQLYGTFPNTSSLPGLGPVDTRGLPLHPEYLQQMAAIGQRCMLGDCHSTRQPSSVMNACDHFPDGGSHLASPHPPTRHGRKRALSSSPYLSDMDISTMIRFSPNSLNSFMNGSRSSSASGSYGHCISAGTLSPVSFPQQTGSPHLHHLMRQNGPMFLSSFAHQPLLGQYNSSLSMAKLDGTVEMPGRPETASNIVSSTVEEASHTHAHRMCVKKEYSAHAHELIEDDKDTVADMKDEPEGDFIETVCHWHDCTKEFTTQDDLVKHINDEHIHGCKKSFICRWKDCSRDEKPFKAQYMLVVHMRRHTGEKPHKCTFEGCSKAYSRLENLKTHLRSHTGEKPYICEFPGCTKAFSNASDRAKHQNRTHSGEKPYICKAPGCTKRYTDPSSLRKHVKTVHGADFYANKKHKGSEGKDVDKDINNQNLDPASTSNSPNSEGSNATHATSMSSPSIKSEGSPQGDRDDNADGVDAPISDNSISTTSGAVEADSVWEITENAEIEALEEQVILSPCGVTSSINKKSSRLKTKIQARLKTARSWFSLPSKRGNNRNNETQSHVHENITKVNSTTAGKVNRLGSQTETTSIKPINGNLPYNGEVQQTVRRNSGSSTVSSFYSSMQSEASSQPLSTHSSKSSQGPACSLQALSSPYDPISVGSSRRSSEASGSLSSGLAHLHKIHAKALTSQHLSNTSNLVVQTQHDSLTSDCETYPKIPTATFVPRSVSSLSAKSQTSEKHTRNSNLQRSQTHVPSANSKNHHPNQNVVLEALEEDKPIEENQDLILPDEMVSYLHERAEQGQRPNSALSQTFTSVSQYNSFHPHDKETNSGDVANSIHTNNISQASQIQEERQSISNGWSCSNCQYHHSNHNACNSQHCFGQQYCTSIGDPSSYNNMQPQQCNINNQIPHSHNANSNFTNNSNFNQNIMQGHCNPNILTPDQRCGNSFVQPNQTYQNSTANNCHQNVFHSGIRHRNNTNSSNNCHQPHSPKNFPHGVSQSTPINNHFPCTPFEHLNLGHNTALPHGHQNINSLVLSQHNHGNMQSSNMNICNPASAQSYVRPTSPSSPFDHNVHRHQQCVSAAPSTINNCQSSAGQAPSHSTSVPPLRGVIHANHSYNPQFQSSTNNIQSKISGSQFQSSFNMQPNLCPNGNQQCYNQSSYVQGIGNNSTAPACNENLSQCVSNQNRPSHPCNLSQSFSEPYPNPVMSIPNDANKQETLNYYNHVPDTTLNTSANTLHSELQPKLLNHNASVEDYHGQNLHNAHRLCSVHIEHCSHQQSCFPPKQTSICDHSANASLQAQHSASSINDLDAKSSSVSAAAASCRSCSNDPREIQCQNVSQSSLSGMHPDAYQRTLEYVQQCQQLFSKQQPSPSCNRVSSSTDRQSPAASQSQLLATNNMVINDLNSGLFTLVEETKFLHLLQ